jgi:O-antigen/teichoic acid export membrane protein
MVVVVLSLATVIIVSRLLTPEEIGIFSVTAALVGLGHVFRDFGVANYLIQAKEITIQRKRAAFTVTLGFSWTIALLLAVVHPLVADFYGDERVGHVLLLLIVNFLLLPFGAPLRTLLQRDMQFKKLAVVNLANHFTQSITTVGCALAGASYASMAWGSIAGNLANVVVLIAISPRGAVDWPTRHGLGEVLRFGAQSSTASFAGAAGSAAPDLILGRTLGFADVAFLSRAKGMIGLALDQLMHVVQSVYTPAFARGVRQGQPPDRMYVETSALLLGVTVPAIALLAVLAPQLIVWMFGEPWARSGPLGTLLCLFALITAPFVLAGSSLVAAGYVGAMMRTRLVVEATRVGALCSSLFLSLEGVVAVLGAVYLVESSMSLRALRRQLGLSTVLLLAGIWRSYALGVVTVTLPLAWTLFGPSRAPAWALLGVAAVLGFAAWLSGLFLLRHPLRLEVRGLAKHLWAKWMAWLKGLQT